LTVVAWPTKGTLILSLICTAMLLLMMCAHSNSQAAQVAPNETSVAELIVMIKTEQAFLARYELASRLPGLVDRQKTDPVDPAMVDAVTALLEDPLDGVRFFAALALGRIGPPAARVVPILATALKRAEDEFIRPGQLGPSSFSGDAICEAFERIGSTPTDAHCRSGFYGR